MARQFATQIALPADPTAALQAATKQYVDNAVPPGWVNVRNYGALGNGSTNDTTAIQNALNATPGGGVCYVPPGVYMIATPLTVPPRVTLEGTQSAGVSYATGPALACVIKGTTGFTGSALLRLVDKTTGAYATDSLGQRVRNLTFDATGVSASVVGIEVFGYVRQAAFEEVTVRTSTGNGFITTGHTTFTGDARSPREIRWENCYADSTMGAGFVVFGGMDHVLSGCQSIRAGFAGFYLIGCPDTQLIGCRSEYSNNHGYYITSDFGTSPAASGGVQMIGCQSDRSNLNGIFIDSTGSGIHNITGFVSRRDGSNGGAGGGNYAGVQITGATTPVMMDGLTVFPGVNDDGTGVNSPQFGIRAGTSTHVSVDSGYIHAASTAVSDAGSNTYFSVNPAVGTATGATTAPVRSSPAVIETRASRGAANGYAPLDAAADVPYANLPVGTTAGTTIADGGHTHAAQTSGVGTVLAARATSDLVRTNTTTLADIPGMTVTLEANAVYSLDAWIRYNAPIAGDCRVESAGTATNTTLMSAAAIDSAWTTGTRALATDGTFALAIFGGTGGTLAATLRGSVATTTAGTWLLQMRQSTANATATTVFTNSWMELRRIA